MSDLIEVTDENGQSVTGEPGVVVLKVYKHDCGPCNILAPRFAKLAEEFGDRVTFVQANIETFQKTAARLRVQGYPAVAIFKDGTLVSYTVGAKLERTYREQIDAALR